MSFGPWAPGLERVERIARLRALRAIALTFARRWPPTGPLLIEALARAELDDTALPLAAELLEQLPTIPRRKIQATYIDLGRPLR